MKKVFFLTLKSIFISSLLSFFALGFSAIFLAALWEDSDNKLLYVQFVIALIYLICFYKIHTTNRIETFAIQNSKYNIIQETKEYLAKDGKYIIVIYGICAILCEFSYLIIPFADMPGEQNPIAILCLWFFPFISVINIPILRSLINFIFAIIMIILIENIRSYAIYKKIKLNKKI